MIVESPTSEEIEVFVGNAEQLLDPRLDRVERAGRIVLELLDRGGEHVGVAEDLGDAEIDQRNFCVLEEAGEALGPLSTSTPSLMPS